MTYTVISDFVFRAHKFDEFYQKSKNIDSEWITATTAITDLFVQHILQTLTVCAHHYQHHQTTTHNTNG